MSDADTECFGTEKKEKPPCVTGQEGPHVTCETDLALKNV